MLWQRKLSKFMIFELVVVFVLVFGTSLASEEDENSCQMTEQLHGEMVNIKAAKQIALNTGGMVSVTKGSKVDSFESCEQECCGNINCTVYMYYPRPPDHDHLDQYNCFLLNCRPQNVCALLNVTDKAPGAVVGLRDLEPSAIENSAELKNEVQLESSVSNSQSLVSSDVKSGNSSAVEQKGDLKTTMMPTKSSTVSNSTVSSITVSSSTVTPTTSKPTANETETATVVMKKKDKVDDTNHTTGASLVIALCFGILFLLAILVLIGRPWWYSFHRPRYSKVDYLMNGL